MFVYMWLHDFFFFVNDITIMYYSQYFKQIDVFEQKFFEIYEMKNIDDVEWFFNIRITRDKKHQKTFFCQNSYVDKLINKFNIDMIKKASEFFIINYISMIKNESKVTSQKVYSYQQRVEFINFAIVTTRSNVIVAVFKLAEYLTNSSEHHMKQTNRTLEYLAHTKNYVIVYNEEASNSDVIFLNFFDVSFANDINTRQNSNDYCFKLFDDLIDWKTSKQKTIIINFTKAELMIMSMIVNTKMWWNRFFDAIDMKMKEFIHIECDNRQTIRVFITSATKLIIKLRHVDIHRHWLRQKIQKSIITIQWIFTASILANEFTKIFSSQKHKKFVKLINLKRIQLSKTLKITTTRKKFSQSEILKKNEMQHQN